MTERLLKVLIRQLAGNDRLPIRGKGFDGCGKLLKDGWKYLNSLPDLNCSRFIIAHDADQREPQVVRRELIDKIVKPSGVKSSFCLLVPVEEIEAWLLADIEAVSKIFKGWSPDNITNPESNSDPKEFLEKRSRLEGGRPRYSDTTHNPKLAKHIDLTTVFNRCKSFRPLEEFVKNGKGNY